MRAILYAIPDMEEVTVEVPCWKLAVILNDQLMFQGDNPLGFDGCPFVPVFWNYEPHNTYYDLRVAAWCVLCVILIIFLIAVLLSTMTYLRRQSIKDGRERLEP